MIALLGALGGGGQKNSTGTGTPTAEGAAPKGTGNAGGAQGLADLIGALQGVNAPKANANGTAEAANKPAEGAPAPPAEAPQPAEAPKPAEVPTPKASEAPRPAPSGVAPPARRRSLTERGPAEKKTRGQFEEQLNRRNNRNMHDMM